MSIKLGCHVSMCAPDYLIGSLNEALSQEANCFMVYTGSPQSIFRVPTEKLHIEEFKNLLKEANIPLEDVIIHAPYLINLAKATDFAIKFFNQELERVKAIGAKYLVLHPGSNEDKQAGIKNIADCLNNAKNDGIVICLETMTGKGNEIGSKFEELKAIIDMVKDKSLIGVCLDTCHIHDSGYGADDIENILKQFDQIIGLDYLKVIHINDSLNNKGAKKDRHANIDEGKIGLRVLQKWANHPKLDHICKILETPWAEDQYKKEIRMLRGK